MLQSIRFGRRHIRVGWVLAALCAISAPMGAAASVRIQPDGALQIAGRNLKCGSIRNVLDPDLPNLGTTSRRRNVLTLNPERLERYSSTIGLFVFHHECGHHHVGGDELEADCWAVHQGLRDGWLDKSHLRSICRSFGNRRETETHPAGEERCASLHQCFVAASAIAKREEVRPQAGMDTSSYSERRPRHAAAEPATTNAPPLPVGTLLLVFAALVLAGAPRRRLARGARTATAA